MDIYAAVTAGFCIKGSRWKYSLSKHLKFTDLHLTVNTHRPTRSGFNLQSFTWDKILSPWEAIRKGITLNQEATIEEINKWSLQKANSYLRLWTWAHNIPSPIEISLVGHLCFYWFKRSNAFKLTEESYRFTSFDVLIITYSALCNYQDWDFGIRSCELKSSFWIRSKSQSSRSGGNSSLTLSFKGQIHTHLRTLNTHIRITRGVNGFLSHSQQEQQGRLALNPVVLPLQLMMPFTHSDDKIISKILSCLNSQVPWKWNTPDGSLSYWKQLSLEFWGWTWEELSVHYSSLLQET